MEDETGTGTIYAPIEVSRGSDEVYLRYDDGSAGTWQDETTITFDGKVQLPNCVDGQIVVYQNDSLTCIDQQEAQMNYLTISGILTIVIVTIIVSKWIVPKINWRTLVRGFFHLIYKPVKKEAKEVSQEWEQVNFEYEDLEKKINREG